MSLLSKLSEPHAGVVTTVVNGKTFASGLFWQPLTRPRSFMQEARAIGKREGMDIVAIRRATIMQAGFISKNQGVTKGMYSMAAALAGQLGKSWIGVFKVPQEEDRFVFVAVNDGVIVPGCDLVGDRETVRSTLQYKYSYFEWEKVYAPADFEFGGEEVHLEEILRPAALKKDYKLLPLTFGLTKKEVFLLGGAAVALVAVLIGVQEWRANVAKLEAAELQKQIAARAAAKRAADDAAAAELANQRPPQPWDRQASIADFVTGCEGGINSLPLAIDGWLFESAHCDGEAISATYARQERGTASGFVQGVAGRFERAPVFDIAGNSGTFILPVELTPRVGDALGPLADVMTRLVSHFQALDLNVDIKEIEPEAPAPQAVLPGQEKDALHVPMAPDWKTYSFETQSLNSPARDLAGLSVSPARLKTLAVRLDGSSATLNWHIAGEVHGK